MSRALACLLVVSLLAASACDDKDNPGAAQASGSSGSSGPGAATALPQALPGGLASNQLSDAVAAPNPALLPGGRLFDGRPGDLSADNDAVSAAFNPQKTVAAFKGYTAGADPHGLRTADVPPPTPAAESWRDRIDVKRAWAYAKELVRGVIGYTGACLHYVYLAMSRSRLFTPQGADASERRRYAGYFPDEIIKTNVDNCTAPDGACQLARLKDRPDLMRAHGIGLLDPRTRPLPVGTTVVYGASCPGYLLANGKPYRFDARAGHIEGVVAATPDSPFYSADSDGGTRRKYSDLEPAIKENCVTMFIPIK